MDTMKKALVIISIILIVVASYLILREAFNFDVIKESLAIIKGNPVGAHVVENITTQTGLGIFYIFVLFSLVFIPGPLEITFLAIYANAPNKFSVVALTILGIVVGQIINYLLGLIVSMFYKPQQAMKDNINKYGGWFIFAGTVIPFLPSQFLNFVAGSVKFKFIKWLAVVIIGTVLYYVVLALAATQITAWLGLG